MSNSDARSFPPRDSGEGDRALARWAGRGPQRLSCVDNEALSQKPPPPSFACWASYGWSPSPASRGRMLFFVIAGLDPAIHDATSLDSHGGGNDEGNCCGFRPFSNCSVGEGRK